MRREQQQRDRGREDAAIHLQLPARRKWGDLLSQVAVCVRVCLCVIVFVVFCLLCFSLNKVRKGSKSIL